MDKIRIFSLGGLDEMGKNTYVVEVDDDIFVFDCGVKYAEGLMYGIDYIIPDYDYLVKNKKRIKGVFIMFYWLLLSSCNLFFAVSINSLAFS